MQLTRIVFLAFPMIAAAYMLSSWLIAQSAARAVAWVTGSFSLMAFVVMVPAAHLYGAVGTALTLVVNEFAVTTALLVLAWRRRNDGHTTMMLREETA